MDSDHPMHHPFHLHGAGRFLVLARDGAPEPNLVWKDTVLVRTGQTVDIMFDVTNPGLWMAHCHIAEHMQSGMMFSFTVDRERHDDRREPTEGNEKALDPPLDVVVIGAGQAGLAVAWHLARRGLRFVVLEAADELGHSWRTRWDSLRLFSPAQYDALPGMAFPAPADTYPGKEAVADFLRDYASAFDLPVRLSTRVTALSRIGDEFEVRTGDEVLRARQVVVATGPFQVPFIPAGRQGFDAAVTQIHSADYRNPQSLPPGPVLVVGAGNSGLQIAEELAATRQVDVSVGEKVPMLPQRLLGRDLFWWLTRRRASCASTPPPGSAAGCRLAASSSSAPTAAGSSGPVSDSAPASSTPRDSTARFADGSTLDASVVVWATGYRSDYSWIDVPGVVADGRVVHRRGVTDVPGLYFLGLSWQYTRGSALLGFVADDAAYLAETDRHPGRGRSIDPSGPCRTTDSSGMNR